MRGPRLCPLKANFVLLDGSGASAAVKPDQPNSRSQVRPILERTHFSTTTAFVSSIFAFDTKISSAAVKPDQPNPALSRSLYPRTNTLFHYYCVRFLHFCIRHKNFQRSGQT
eukprot:TRINITY_DN886_c0_g1_i14.p2 TRINITY_DN886_c0_g1~~TRINITY_DN886_c0_g1_i14.p2  ORF type:complete len:112 (-),score=7.63 TRINITY_DN886_c0_g1_i14:67-402(-)